MLVKDLITLLKEYDDDTRVALPIHNSSNYSETIAHDYGDVLVLEGSRQWLPHQQLSLSFLLK